MRLKRLQLVFSIVVAAALCVSPALAQVGAAVHGVSQTDVAVSLYGAFSGTTNGNNTVQSPANSAGGIIELRYIGNPIAGFDVAYSFNRANQDYKYTIPPSCPAPGPCQSPQGSVSANAHEIQGDWVVSLKIANLRPFGLVGAGLLLDQPASGQSSTSSSTKPVFVYGAGLDWGLLPHIGLRLQYRGNLYKAPDLTKLYTSTGAFTHTAEPMIGAYFRF
jgi:opacity protein-like surface antigen